MINQQSLKNLINFQNVSLNGTGSTVVGLTVTLFDVNLFTTGLYGCEASADPSFHTELVRKHMTILGKTLLFGRRLRESRASNSVCKPILATPHENGRGQGI